ncbi:MAG TPA: flagellar protein FliS, partial [Terriglobales bacterium]|nr:flagellar protein FliS [Terriglobales bacterium]
VAAKLKHGYLALARLEGALDTEIEGTEKIARFYTMSREQMLKAQVQRDPAILRQLIGFLNDMREAWVEVQGRENAEQPGTLSKISNAAYAVTEIAAAASWKA